MTADSGTRRLREHVTPRFTLESGEELRDVRQAYHLDGTLDDGRTNLVLICHSLTASPDAAGDWWRDVIGPGAAIDTDRFAVLAPNLLGSCFGTTRVDDRPDSEPPRITTRDQARLINDLVRALGVTRVALVTGGSLGGMVALEYAATFPTETARAVIFAAPAAHTAWAIGWNAIQRAALDVAGADGLRIARMVGMMTYRTEREFEERFGRTVDATGTSAMSRYLEHHGDKLLARFDQRSYRILLGAMDSHDVGRDRGGIANALAALGERCVAVGIEGDNLYSPAVVREWAERAGAAYCELRSVRGHDAFLLERDQVATILRGTLPAVIFPGRSHTPPSPSRCDFAYS